MAFNWPAGLTCWSFLGLEPPERLRGHDAPGDGHQGIFATIPGSQAHSQGTSWPADWVARLAWLPRA